MHEDDTRAVRAAMHILGTGSVHPNSHRPPEADCLQVYLPIFPLPP